MTQKEICTHMHAHTHTHTHTHTHCGMSLFIQLGRDSSARSSIPCPFDVWKVEGNQSHFLHSGRCGLWFLGAGRARLAVKYRWGCRVWEVYGAPHVAKVNRGNCWSQAPTAGRGKGRWSKRWIVISALRSCTLSFSVIREPEIPFFPALAPNLFICLFNWVTFSGDEKSLL